MYRRRLAFDVVDAEKVWSPLNEHNWHENRIFSESSFLLCTLLNIDSIWGQGLFKTDAFGSVGVSISMIVYEYGEVTSCNRIEKTRDDVSFIYRTVIG